MMRLAELQAKGREGEVARSTLMTRDPVASLRTPGWPATWVDRGTAVLIV
jgi:hypothetical protein